MSISISFKSKAPAGYVDSRLDCRLSIVDCRSEPARCCWCRIWSTRNCWYCGFGIVFGQLSAKNWQPQRDSKEIVIIWPEAPQRRIRKRHVLRGEWVVVYRYIYIYIVVAAFSSIFWLVCLFIICCLLFAPFDLNYNFM